MRLTERTTTQFGNLKPLTSYVDGGTAGSVLTTPFPIFYGNGWNDHVPAAWTFYVDTQHVLHAGAGLVDLDTGQAWDWFPPIGDEAVGTAKITMAWSPGDTWPAQNIIPYTYNGLAGFLVRDELAHKIPVHTYMAAKDNGAYAQKSNGLLGQILVVAALAAGAWELYGLTVGGTAAAVADTAATTAAGGLIESGSAAALAAGDAQIAAMTTGALESLQAGALSMGIPIASGAAAAGSALATGGGVASSAGQVFNTAKTALSVATGIKSLTSGGGSVKSIPIHPAYAQPDASNNYGLGVDVLGSFVQQYGLPLFALAALYIATRKKT